MKTNPRLNPFKSALKQFAPGDCLTIFSTLCSGLVVVSLWLTACTQGGGTSNNYYTQPGAGTNGAQSPLSGGGGSGGGQGGSTGDGGGGQGVQCGKSSNSVLNEKLFVRDVYEAIYNQKLTLKSISAGASSDDVSPEAIKVLVQSLKFYFGPASRGLKFTNEEFWNEFVKKISFLEDEKVLYPSQDANSPIRLPEECRIVQIAYWDESAGGDSDGTLYVNKKLWKELDQMNKIGLLAHEFFFANARRAKFKNSDSVRTRVGQLLSTKGLTPLFANWVPSKNPVVKGQLPDSQTGFKRCEGESADDPTAKLHLYQYQGDDKLQHIVIPALVSATINGSYLQGAHTTFDPEKQKNAAMATDLLVLQSDLRDAFWVSAKGMDRTFDRWHFDSGLLFVNQRGGTWSHTDLLFGGLYSRPDSLWMSPLLSSYVPTKLTIRNSLYRWESAKQKEAESRENLIITINQDIYSAMTECSLAKDQAETALATLHKEIKTGIDSGKYPTGFPEWNQSLKTFKGIFDKNNTPYKSVSCKSLTTDKKTTRELPGLLYKLLVNNYNILDVEEVLGQRAWKPTDSVYDTGVPTAQIEVSQGDSTLTFNVTCEDYTSTYLHLAVAGENFEKDVELKYPKTVEDKLDVSIIRKRAERNEANPEKTIMYYKRFVEFLKMNMAGSREDFKSYDRDFDNTIYLNINKGTDRAYFRDLKQETSIAVENCDQSIEGSKDGSTAINRMYTQCAVVSMKTLKRRYMIYFSYSEVFSAPEEEFPPLHVFSKLIPEN